MSEGLIQCGLDIGTTKVSALVADVTEPRAVEVLGVGTAPCEGLRRGVVVDLERTISSIRRAVEAAERMAGVTIRSVAAGIAGDHIRSINSRGVIAVARRDHEIGPADVSRVVDAARAVAIPADREIIHVLPQEFIVDNQGGIKEPVGMCGVRLEAEVHIITGAAAAARNLSRAIERAGLRVDNLVLEPLASARSVLTPDEEDLGVVLLDLGGGTTDMAIFHQGAIRHTAVIGMGGSNVTSDLAIGLRTPIDQAERLKLESGCALTSLVEADDTITVPGVGGREDRVISRQTLAAMIEPRVEEILTHAAREFQRTPFGTSAGSGVVLTGGAAAMDGVVQLAEEIFELPARVGFPIPLAGQTDQIDHPMYATAVGLLLVAAVNGTEMQNRSESLIDKLSAKLKNLVAEFH
ncbi:MAG: cell division protein FtsA [Candidatus Eiseniibacteriota bacterium]